MLKTILAQRDTVQVLFMIFRGADIRGDFWFRRLWFV